jgi:hypothetical protein
MTTMLAIHILILLSSSRNGLRNFLINLGSILGTILWNVLLFVGLGFARLISSFFFVLIFTLIIAPSWLLDHFSTNNATDGIENSSSEFQKTNGIPEGWIRVRICRTDEISDLDLDWETQRTSDEDTDRTVVQGGEREGWEDRDIFVVTKEEIERRVWTWMETLDE